MDGGEIFTALHNGQQHRAGSGGAGTGQNVMIGESDALKRVWFCVEQVAPIDTTVLILGETGTGKELVARAIHSCSARRDRPLAQGHRRSWNQAGLSPARVRRSRGKSPA